MATPAPTPADKFTFGLWTIGYNGTDPFGGPTRPPLDVVHAVEKLAELGAYGLTFHDDDPFAFGSTDAERQAQIDRLKGALSATGRRVARFSGGESEVTLLSPPADGSDQLRIETGTGKGSFRIQGFVKAAELRIFTGGTVPIVGQHVRLRPGARVVLSGASAG